MKNALKQLLNSLDQLTEEGHDEVQDTDVREHMAEAVHNLLVEPKPDYELPDEFGMFSPEGNQKVKAILARFFADPEVSKAKSLPTPKQRLAAFQDVKVQSSAGNCYDEYFGYDGRYE